MKIALINLTYDLGSTGHIVADLDKVITNNGHKSLIIAGYSNTSKTNLISMQTFKTSLDIRIDLLISRITGLMGYRSIFETKKIIAKLSDFKPDIIHLHNIHGDFINIFMLFDFIQKNQIPVIWTLHDCWTFTGRCSHFELNKCDQWRNGCCKCSKLQKRVYPITYFWDFSKKMWNDKKNLFLNTARMSFVMPSVWLSRYFTESFLQNYDYRIINNGIDVNRFRPVKTKSKYITTSDKKIILGVASSWSERKGLTDIIELDKRLDHEKELIVLVGLNSRQMKKIPKTILGIPRTNNVEELVELYSNADVFINPTYQDNYPTVNLEAISCGTPVVTYATGGSPESISEDTGEVIAKGDIDALYKSITDACNGKFQTQKCRAFAEENFDKEKKYREYLNLYEEVYNKNIQV